MQYATANGTATAGADYTGGSGTLTFNPGVTSLPITVPVTGETAAEPNETFAVNLTSPVNGVFGDNQGAGTIINDDSGTIVTTATFQVQAGGDDVNEESERLHRQFVDRLGRQRRDGVDQLRRLPLHRRRRFPRVAVLS